MAVALGVLLFALGFVVTRLAIKPPSGMRASDRTRHEVGQS